MPREELLYHYTSFEGLLGILRSQSLWATSLHYLNDTEEFRYGNDVIRREFRTVGKYIEAPAGEVLNTIANNMTRRQFPHVFVFSLSKAGDQLSQWRGYCPAGAGVAIGFSRQLLERRAADQEFKLAQCVYDAEAQRTLAVELVRDTTQQAKAGEASVENIIIEAENKIMEIAPRLKNETFEEEVEWRLISRTFAHNDGHFRFRSNRTILIPYLEFAMTTEGEPLIIGEIVVGPNREPDLARRALLDVFASTNAACRRVRNSRIPYREL